jgi:hypothetical protein
VIVFTPEFVSSVTKRWALVADSGRPLIAKIAVDDDRDDDRQRIERWTSRLHVDDRATMAKRLQSKDQFITAYGELMTAQVLMNAGLMVRYEREFRTGDQLLTPDWSSATPSIICDSFTAGLRDDRDKHETSLREIEREA